MPAEILGSLCEKARLLPDTDWYVDRLYQWAPEVGAGLIVAPMSRYVIDLNRPPDDAPLYDQTASSVLTGLVPVRMFSGNPVYVSGAEPDAPQIRRRVELYWEPYHLCLRDELERIRSRHGHAVLLDAHSIRSYEPMLFSGKLPDLNLGSNSGASAARPLIEAACTVLQDSPWSTVLDGRFKGGYITRHFGTPKDDIHALQLEMAQCAYMQEDPVHWSDELARPMQNLLHRLVEVLMRWMPGHD